MLFVDTRFGAQAASLCRVDGQLELAFPVELFATDRHRVVFFDRAGNPFDDIGGMLVHNRAASEDVAVFWVHDFDTEEWLKADDAYFVLEAAGSVVIVPGYGMAVAQAQHAVRELGEILENNGTEVRYAIHPVAGRMPGHMNVLLAEANVLYEQLAEMDDVNPIMDTVDVCIVIGANDVVNPAAREIESSPIYGMPVIDVDKAKTVIVLKRSMAAGFAGVDNPLFVKENTRMLFGDAKATVQQLVTEFKES